MTANEILETLTQEDWDQLLKASGGGTEYIVDVITCEVQDPIILDQAKQLAAMRKFGVNSPEYVALIREEEKFVRRK